eukprot:347250-Chlamydomonas_euryale.AAC.3
MVNGEITMPSTFVVSAVSATKCPSMFNIPQDPGEYGGPHVLAAKAGRRGRAGNRPTSPSPKSTHSPLLQPSAPHKHPQGRSPIPQADDACSPNPSSGHQPLPQLVPLLRATPARTHPAPLCAPASRGGACRARPAP